MSSSLRSVTFTERKPPPTGVVIGPFSATPVSRIASRTASGSGLPSFSSITSVPACWRAPSNSTPVASSARRVASVNSGPVPSPGMSVTRCAKPPRMVSRRGSSAGDVTFRAMAPKKSVQLSGVSVAETSICSIDAERGVLMYRGYDIADLAEHSTYEEVAYLLLHGELPAADEVDRFREELATRGLPPHVEQIVDRSATSALPMDMLRTAVSALGFTDPDRGSNAREAELRKAARLIAEMPTVIARYERRRQGLDPVDPDPSLSYAESFLTMLHGEAPSEHAARA